MAPVVLLPGIVGSRTIWEPVAERLRDDHEVCLVDLPTAGRDFHALGDRVLEALEPGCFILVGFSFGGLVARAMAERYPNRTEGLLMVGSLPGREFLPTVVRMAAWALQGLPHGYFAPVYRAKLDRSLRREGVSPGDIERLNSQLPSKDVYLSRLEMIAAWGLGERIEVPAGFVYGNEGTLGRRSSERARTLLPEVSFGRMTGGHHGLWTHPDIMAEIIDEFVGQRGA